MHTRRLVLASLLTAGFVSRSSWAQNWPQRPVSLIHGFGAGGNADSIARIVASALSAEIGQQVVVEAKPGAGGNIASEAVSRAEPDGHTIVLLTGGHAVSAVLYKSLRFKPLDDFAFASLVATFPFVVATHNGSTIRSIADLIETARKEPGKLTFSSVGLGSTQHLTGELFAGVAGIKLTHVPYRGGVQPLTDLMAGRIDLMVDTITVAGPAIRAGTIRGLGVTSGDPWPTLPEVSPIAGTLPGFNVRSWVGLAAPAATSPTIVARLNAAIGKALQSPQIKESLALLGVQPGASTPDGMREFVAAEIARWNGVVESSSIERL